MLGDGEALRRLWSGPLQDLVSKLNGEKGPEWVKALKRFLRRENPWETQILSLDRNRLFDPAGFLGKDWSIEEEDERSLALQEIDLSQVQLVIMLTKRESVVKGEEKLRRLKEAGYVRLDAKIFQELWENQEFIPEDWKEKVVYFDGTVFQSPVGGRCVLDLYWSGSCWNWNYNWLENDWNANKPSAVLVTFFISLLLRRVFFYN